MLHRLLVFYFALGATFAQADDGQEFFEKKIRPVLVRHCYECHSSALAKPKGGLRVDSRDAIRKGGETAPAVDPGRSEKSLLIKAIRYESLEMPPKQKLPDAVIADFVKWVKMGAPDPRDAAPDAKTAARQQWEIQFEKRRQWWSLQPVVNPPIPKVRKADWSDQPIDRFILAKLEQQDLRPARRADHTTLIRRLSFALTGLPPTPVDVQTFLDDTSPRAYEKLVGRLLDSPHFGEHWARHWMDVVRYTDTYGYEWDIPAKGAWRYRDYLIRALNADVPFDQLVREQIAGDLLDQPRINRDEQINESLLGTMFFQMGEKRHGDSSEFNGIHQEMLDNKIDAFSKAFQATTISCARCHDHKLDAVAQREYYALAGVFMSSRWVTNTADLPQRNANVFRELKAIKTKLRSRVAAVWQTDIGKFSDHLVAASGKSPPAGRWRELVEERRKKAPSFEDPLSVWMKIVVAKDDVTETWKNLAEHYAAESKKRASENAKHFKFVDFRDGILADWSVDGVGAQDIAPCGDFNVPLDGEAAIGRLIPGGIFTRALSPRMNAALRTPYLNTFAAGNISFEASGGDFAAHRTVIDNAFLTEKQTYLNHADTRWIQMSTRKSMKDRRIYIEFATKTSNPNFPPRVGLGGKCSEEQAADPRSWFCVTRAALHDVGRMPADELLQFKSLLHGEPPKTLDQAAQRYAAWYEHAVQSWSAGKATDQDVNLINWLLDNKLLANDRKRQEIANFVNRYRTIEKTIRIPWTVNGMADVDTGYDYRLNIRGDYDQLGQPIPRGYLKSVGQVSQPDTTTRSVSEESSAFNVTGSGRRELAELIASPNNPLTARVFVNRVWLWLFGTGIVATPSDFGHLGEQPSHPKLLDYLAHEFVANGWSTKKLVKSIVMSETWRQSGETNSNALDHDPDNRLLHHYPLRRLEAESIRDAMLAASGRLDRCLFGSPINPHRANEDPQKRLFSGPLDGNGRRSIYTKITIMEPPRFLALFNQPKPKIPTGRRDVTNTPAQSLALLNDPFVIGQAEHWAKRLVERKDGSLPGRLTHMFQRALGRKPTAAEINRWTKAIDDLTKLHKTPQAEIMDNGLIWKDTAHALFNTREFVFVR